MADLVRYGISPILAHVKIDSQTFERVREGNYLIEENDLVHKDRGIEIFYKDNCTIIFDKTHYAKSRIWEKAEPRSIVLASEDRQTINNLAKKLGLPEVPESTSIRPFDLVENQ